MFKDSEEVQDMAIMEALQIYLSTFQDGLIVESNTSSAISYVNFTAMSPRKFQFLLNKFKYFSFSIQVFFWHIGSSANCIEDSLAETGGQ